MTARCFATHSQQVTAQPVMGTPEAPPAGGFGPSTTLRKALCTGLCQPRVPSLGRRSTGPGGTGNLDEHGGES